jgi:hypothetical protein
MIEAAFADSATMACGDQEPRSNPDMLRRQPIYTRKGGMESLKMKLEFKYSFAKGLR